LMLARPDARIRQNQLTNLDRKIKERIDRWMGRGVSSQKRDGGGRIIGGLPRVVTGP
jgi:hypothetical protein